MEEQKGLRMYFFVMYNLSGIQKGIQCGHAALEYANTFRDDPQYQDFIENHKTFILLDGGGSGDMLDRYDELNELGITFAFFREPDLNHAMSAIAFILPESIYGYNVFDVEEIAYDYDLHTKYEYFRKFRLASN